MVVVGDIVTSSHNRPVYRRSSTTTRPPVELSKFITSKTNCNFSDTCFYLICFLHSYFNKRVSNLLNLHVRTTLYMDKCLYGQKS